MSRRLVAIAPRRRRVPCALAAVVLAWTAVGGGGCCEDLHAEGDLPTTLAWRSVFVAEERQRAIAVGQPPAATSVETFAMPLDLGAGVSVTLDSLRGVHAAGPGAECPRVVEARTVSRRDGGLAGIGVDITAAGGFVIDLRLGIALTHWSRGIVGGELAPEQPPPERDRSHGGLGFKDFDSDDRDLGIFPRLRIGVGWRW